MQRAVISFGEALWDLLPEGAVLGGAPCNLAARISELGNHAQLVSRVGDDALGKEALSKIRALGLDTAHVQVDPSHPTGTVEVKLDANRQPDYEIIQNVAYDFIETDEALLDASRSAHCISFGVLAQRGERSRQTLAAMLDAASANALKFLDINLRKKCYTRETVAESLRRADVLKLNEDEAVLLCDLLELPAQNGLTARAEAILSAWPLDHCIVTLGERGALCVSAEGTAVYEPGYATELADPLGAGDAFSAGFIHNLMAGESVRDCVRLGNALGAVVAGQRGGTQPIDRESLEQFHAENVRRNIDESLRHLCIKQ